MNILIIKACGVNGENEECVSIKTQMELYGVKPDIIEPSSTLALVQELNCGKQYDYIYLSAHGDDCGFGNEDSSIDISWSEFAQELCNSGIMGEDSIVMLSCCRGGLHQVAYQLFYACPNINYVIGPKQSLASTDMLIGFNLIFYNLHFRGVDATIATEKVKAGADLRFACFDRLETEAEYAYQRFQIIKDRERMKEERERMEEVKRQIELLEKTEKGVVPSAVIALRNKETNPN